MARSYRDAFGHDIDQALGKDWATLHPFPQVPAFMARAPVYPSTSD